MNTLPTPLTRAAWSTSKTDALADAAFAPSAAYAPTDDMVVHSSALLKGQRTIAIAHNGAVYRLQATRQGKLILTK